MSTKNPQESEEFGIDEVIRAIRQQDAGWTAEVTPLSDLSLEERQLRLGYVPGPGDPSLEEAESRAAANFEAFRSIATRAVMSYPGTYDLRNVGGKNYITSVKDQGGCGSCVAFGSVAAVEGSMRRQLNQPTLAIDLSEAHLFYCHARSEGRLCSNGWWSSNALNAFRDKGVTDESCYPYTAADQNCTGLCADAPNRLTKVTSWKRLTSHQEIKEWISNRGPAVACYTVYQDFFNYKSGIYRHVTGGVAGGHCVCCVGYNDSQGYWICKNSWGTTWGENGYFRIAYGQCGIDDGMDVIEGTKFVGWRRDMRITGLWANDQDRNAWVHVNGLGWRQLSRNNDNIFFTMLNQAIAAKAGNRRIDFREDGNVIHEIYVF